MRSAVFLSVISTLVLCSCADQKAGESDISVATTEPVQTASHPDRVALSIIDDSPRIGITLRQSIPALREKIAQGDAVAGCQLAREFDFCAGAEKHAEYLRRVEAQRRPGVSAGDGHVDAGSTLTDLAGIRAEYCAGASTIPTAERISLWRQAALRGHVPAMLQYGSGLAFGHDKTLSALDELRAYKEEGPKLVQTVAKNGGFQANLLLARAFAPYLSGPNWTPLLRQAVTQDAAISLAYYRLARELRPANEESAATDIEIDTEMTPLRWSMSKEELANSERKYAELRSQLTFSDKTLVDIKALNHVDVDKPVPGTELCSEGGILR